MSALVTRPTRNRRPGRYQLSPYDKVSQGTKAKFKAYLLYGNNQLYLDQLKLIQYAFDKGGNGRYLWFIRLCIFYSLVHIYWLANTLLLVCVFSEILSLLMINLSPGIISWAFCLTRLWVERFVVHWHAHHRTICLDALLQN